MEKYISDIVKAEDIIIKTESLWKSDNTRLFRVEVTHTPNNIKIHKYRYSQMEAYNVCIEYIESAIKFKEFKDYYDVRPDLFAEEFLGIKLLGYQKLMLRMASKSKVKRRR